MTRTVVICLATGLLAACDVGAQSSRSPLCDIGSSVVDLMYLQSTGASARIDPSILGGSLVFLKECPASVIPAFRRFGEHESALRQAWIHTAQAAAGDASHADLRILLAAARARIVQVDDRLLNEYLDGMFQGVYDSQVEDQRSLDALFERQALAALGDYARCDGVGCFDASDVLLFLLGTHPVALFRAMHADSATAVKWLRLVRDDSFAGPPERAEGREAARRAVLSMLAETQAPGFERELHACEERLREIRYRPVQ